MKMKLVCAALVALSTGCAELRGVLGATKDASEIAGETVDALALGRAEQIRIKAGEAAKKAEGGDEAAALRALSEAQAEVTLSLLRELAEARATCAKGAGESIAIEEPKQ